MKYPSVIRSVVTGLALSAAVAGAHAQPGPGAASQSPMAGKSVSADSCVGKQGMPSGNRMSGNGHGMHGAHRMSAVGSGGIPGIGQLPASLIEQLTLNDKQKVALFDAQTASSAMRDQRMAAHSGHREAMRTAAGQDTFDPRAMIELQNKMRDAMQANRDAVQKKWLSFWDSLSKEQQAKISDHIKQKMSHRGHRSMGPGAG